MEITKRYSERMKNMLIQERQQKILEAIKIFDKICRENNIWYTLTSGSILGAVRHKGFIPWDYDMDVFVKITDIEKLRTSLLRGIPDTMKLYIWDMEPKYPLCFDRLSFRDIPHDLLHIDIHPLIGAPDTKNAQIKFTKICYYTFKFLRTKYVNTNYSKPSNIKKIKALKLITRIIPDIFIRKWYHYLQNKYSFEKAHYVYTIASTYGMRECMPKKMVLDTRYVDFEDTKLPIPVKYDEYLTRVYGNYMIPKKDGYKGYKL